MSKVDLNSVAKYGGNNMRGNVVKNVGKPKTSTDGLAWALPSYTDAEEATLSPVAGEIIFNSTSSKLKFYSGTAWEEITSS